MNVKTILLVILAIILIIILINYIRSSSSSKLSNLNSAETQQTIQSTSLPTYGLTAATSNVAFSIWLYVNDWNYNYGTNKIIFQMCPSANTGTLINNDIVAYLDKYQNNIIILTKTNTTGTGTTKTTIWNIPIQQWVNLTISFDGQVMDVYLDGKLVKTVLLSGPMVVTTTNNVYITPTISTSTNMGFSGWTSKFQMYVNSLTPQDAWNIYTAGYGGNVFGNLISANNYQLQVSVIKNGEQQSSLTI